MPISEREIDFIRMISGHEDITPASSLCQPLADLVEMTIMRVGNRSQHTARSYRGFIYRFLHYLDTAVGPRIPDEIAASWRPFIAEVSNHRPRKWVIRPPAAVLHLIEAGILEAFADWLRRGGVGNVTAESRFYGARALLQTACREGVITDSEAFELGVFTSKPLVANRQRDDLAPGRVLSRVEVRWLRNHVDLETNKGKRDLAILDSLLYLALHPEDLVRLSEQSLVQENGCWWLNIPSGRQREARKFKVRTEFQTTLMLWMKALAQSGQNDGLPLFVAVSRGDTIGKRAVGAAAIENVVVTYGAQSRLAPLDGSGRLTSTILRRTCARTAYDNGASLKQIRDLLGYATLESAARFIRLDETNAKADVTEYVVY